MKLSFAHLTGLARPAAGKPKGEDDEDPDTMTKAEGESDEEFEDRKEKARAARADEEDEKNNADDDDGVDDDDKDKDGDPAETKKAKKRARMAARRAYARGRAAGRDRCAAIFASPEAAGRVDTAAQLAFATNLSAKEAIGVLASTPKGGKPGLADRMNGSGAATVRVAPSAPEGPKGKAAIAASWDMALKPFIPNKAA